MKISISGRHMTVTDALQDYAREKAKKLERYYDLVQNVEVVISNEGDRRLVEMIVTARVGGKIIGQMEHEDAYAAIDLLIDKMERQLTKKKEKLKLRKRSGRQKVAVVEEGASPAAAAAEPDDEGESYEDVVEKLEL